MNMYASIPALGLAAVVLAGSCGDGGGGTPRVTDAGATADAAPDGGPGQLAITLTAGHSHIYKETKVAFRVLDNSRCTEEASDAGPVRVCAGVPGLNPTAFEMAAGVNLEQRLSPGVFVDMGDGTYQWTKTFTVLGTNLLGIRFDADGKPHYAAFPFETSRGGGERYFCDLNGDRIEDHAFQVRWNPMGPSVRADGTPTTIQLELLRSTNPPPLNIEEPYRNSFDHLRPGELQGATLRVRLMAGSGSAATEVANLESKYVGRGLYTATRSFTADDLSGQPRRVFWLRVSFTDDKGCLVDTVDEAEYQLPLVP
jgi:hypothetical protein